MRYLTGILFLFLATITAKAQVWDWTWAKDAGGSATETIGGQSVSDLAGNTFVVGDFMSASASFGSFTLPLTGTRNMFIAHYDYLGNVIWARSSSACNDSRALGVALDPMASGVYVTGIYTGPSITFDTVALTSATNGGMFVVKYDNSGNVVWAKNAVESNSSAGRSVAADVWGNCYVAGEYKGTNITFGSTTLNNLGLDTFDAFLVKYNSSGNVVWAKNGGGSGADGANSVSIGSSGYGHVYVTGYFSGTSADFGTLTLNNANSNFNTFLVKYDTAGNAIWARRSVGNTGNNGKWAAAAIDPAEDVYISGSFTGPSVQFDTATLSNANNNTLDIYLVQYDSSGNVKHAMRAGSDKDDIAGVTLDQNVGGRMFLTGYFAGDSISIDTFTMYNHTSNGNTDVFSIGFDDQWNSFFAKSAGGAGNDHAFSCNVHGAGDMYIAGDFDGQYSFFGNDTAENHAINNTGDIFVAKLSIVNTGVGNVPAGLADCLVYPNPSTNIINVQLPENIKDASFSMYDMMGRMVMVPMHIRSGQAQFPVSALPAGVYMLQVKSGGGSQSFRILRQP